MTTIPWDNIIKIITTLIPILGSIVVAYVTKNHSNDRKIMQYERLNKALNDKNHNKLEVSEYFRMATGLRMNYSDIKKIIHDDNSIWMIDFLRRMPGYVSYEDGVFKNSKRFADKSYLSLIRSTTRWFNTFGKYFAGLGYLLFSYGLIYFNITSNISTGWSIFFIIMIFFSAFGFISLSNMEENNKKVDELISLHTQDQYGNKENK